MSKKITGIAICALLFTLSIPAEAQQPTKKVPVIGVLLADTAPAYASYVEAFQQGLRDLGYVVGQNILLEYRYADGKQERFAELADELVRLKVDMIVVVGGTLAAAKHQYYSDRGSDSGRSCWRRVYRQLSKTRR